MNPGLYVVGTPIGNLADITLRALETLRSARLILAEDTRHTRILLARHAIAAPLLSCHRFNEAARIEGVLERISKDAAAVALVSNAGMPGISDPGSRIIRAARAAGVRVEIIPGPSAVTAAAALSGLCDEGFLFGGFLPHKAGARRRQLLEWSGLDVPILLFESPYRVAKLLGELQETLGDRVVFTARELTKRFEETACGLVSVLRAGLPEKNVKGEWVVVVAPAERRREAKEGGSGRGEIDTPPARC